MSSNPSIRTIGIDVHKDSYALSTYCPETDSHIGEITTSSCSKMVINYVRKLKKESGPNVTISSAYEAGPTGFGLQRDLLKAGIECKVMAPTSIYEKKGGNRVKTDRGDARKLSKALHWAPSRRWSPSLPRMRRRGITSGCAMTGEPP